MDAQPQSLDLPLPGRQFQRFIMVFHVVFLGGAAFVLLNRWLRPGFAWTSTDTLLAALVLVQALAYMRFLVFQSRWSSNWVWWTVYFTVAFALWFFSWRIEPGLEWFVLAYLGQLFGIVRPRFSIPIGLAVFAAYLGTKIGWDRVPRLNWHEAISYLSLVVGWTALGLFLHRLVRTSTERAQLIQELRAAREELERARQRDAELAALQERERLARELHDSLGHSLATLSIQLEAVQRLYPVDPARASALLEEMKSLTRTTMEQLRRSLAGLRAPGLGERDLDAAIRDSCRETSKRAGLDVVCETVGERAQVPPAVAEVLWRVTQEGLANMEKHARAKNGVVSLRYEMATTTGADSAARRQAVLTVTDDGVGLPADAEARAGHYGLRGLRERVEGVGGEFRVRKLDGQGTLLEARIPVIQA